MKIRVQCSSFPISIIYEACCETEHICEHRTRTAIMAFRQKNASHARSLGTTDVVAAPRAALRVLVSLLTAIPQACRRAACRHSRRVPRAAYMIEELRRVDINLQVPCCPPSKAYRPGSISCATYTLLARCVEKAG